MKTMICLILDRSGSMNGRQADVIGGVNSFLAEQKKLPDPASIAMVRFDTEATERFRPMGPLTEAQDLTLADYQPRGGTPLLDAVGGTIAKLDEDWKTEQPERCIMVIVTDGEENSSREYTKAKIKELIQARQDSGKWAFIYLGANVDAFHEAGSMGIAGANTGGYVNTARGTKAVYNSMTEAVSMMRTTGATQAQNLGGDIGEDGSVTKRQSTPAPLPQTGPKTWEMKNSFRDMSIKPETAEEVTECADPRGMRKRILEYGYRGDAMTKTILESARYRGLSGEDTMTWLAFEALKKAEHLESLVLEEVKLRPGPFQFSDGAAGQTKEEK